MSEDNLDSKTADYIDIDLEPQKKKMPYALRYGSIAALLGIIYSLILFFVGQDMNQGLGAIGYLFPVVLVFIALKTYKKDNFNRMKGNQGFGLGMMFFLVYAVIVTIYFFLYASVINPDFQAQLLEISEARLEDRGLSDEMIEQQMNITKMIMKPPILAVISIIQIMVIGLIASGIASLIVRSPVKKEM